MADEYIWVIQNGGSKIAEGSSSISANVIINALANFVIRVFHFMATLRGKIDKIWILPLNSTISGHEDFKLRHCANQIFPRRWKWWVNLYR